jgi:RNA polymerase sigma-70 factor (ECF subfamily)
MSADFLDRTNDNEAALAPIANLAGSEDMVLVAAAKSGSSHAFEVLIERHVRRIQRVARCLTSNREDAEDTVQQTFQKAFLHLRKFEGRSSFSTWLTRVAINEGLMLQRKSRRLRQVSVDAANANEETAPPLEIPDSGPDPEAIYSHREWGRMLFTALNELPPRIRMAIQLRELDERSIKESAQMMRVSVPAAKSRVLRGRRKLRKTLNRYVARTRVFGKQDVTNQR